MDSWAAATGGVKKIWLSRQTLAIVLPVRRCSRIARDAKDFGKDGLEAHMVGNRSVFALVDMGQQGRYICSAQNGRPRPQHQREGCPGPRPPPNLLMPPIPTDGDTTCSVAKYSSPCNRETGECWFPVHRISANHAITETEVRRSDRAALVGDCRHCESRP